MLSNRRLLRVGQFDLRMHHLLVIGILAISFSISFMIRSQPAEYGFELNEFDPYYNYRATNFLVENGLEAYTDWHDYMAWHPNGRDISATSQAALHMTAAFTYPVFGAGSTVYDYTIMFPVVFGSLTTVVVFALVRVIAGTTAGLFASLFFAVSVPVIVRGTIGWFKSEPLGLFYGLLAAYLLLSGLRATDRKWEAAARLAGGGIFMAFGLGAWGGIQFFVLPVSVFFLVLPLVRRDLGFLMWAVPLFAASFLLSVLAFERPGIHFVTGVGGLLVAGPAAYLVGSSLLQRFSAEAVRLRNGALLLAGTAAAGAGALVANHTLQFISLPEFRYQNAINPFLTTTNPLVDSVAEHATTTTAQSFFFLSVLMLFAGAGAWLMLGGREKLRGYHNRLRGDMVAFALILGIFGAHISSAYIRLELFASISVIVLASVGLSVLAAEVLKPTVRTKRHSRGTPLAGRIAFVAVTIGLLMVPTVVPTHGNWVDSVRGPPTILNGGTNFGTLLSDWPDTLEWLRTETPEDSIVAAWWDYGYWITTVGNRTSMADNGTLDYEAIRAIARMMLADPDAAWAWLNEMGADYVLLFVAATKIQQEPVEAYLLNGGGDESKKQWFMRIAGDDPVEKYLHADGLSGTPHFWENTMVGHMIPYSLIAYVNFATGEQSPSYVPGFTPVYAKDLKYPQGGDGPLRLAYSSITFDREAPGAVAAVMVYEVNKEYDPDAPTMAEMREILGRQLALQETAAVSTAEGDFTIAFRDDLAPATVKNFKDLARSGFYDGTVFHRIVPGFVVHGGDPNTVAGPRDTWGTGGPGYSVRAELDAGGTHSKYAVSMARGASIDSAGSQFFVVLEDSPWLDGKYTVFGHVTEGTDVVDRLAAVPLSGQPYPEQPADPADAAVNSIRIVEPALGQGSGPPMPPSPDAAVP